MSINTVAVVGCGAMGSVYAARLATAGYRVIAVDRNGDHVAAMNEHGLTVIGPDGERVARLDAFDTAPNEPVDVVILAVKAAAVPSAIDGAAPLIGPDTVVVTIQNGLGSADIVAAEVGGERLTVGIASGFGASLQRPGVAHHNAMKAMVFGAFSTLSRERVEQVVDMWRNAGFEASRSDDIVAMQWRKLICNVAYSAPCALSGRTVGEVMADPHLARVSQAAATEAWQIANALNIAIEVGDPVQFVSDFGANMPDAKPSALLDHEAHRVSEISVINGAVGPAAESIGLSAPVNTTLTELVLAREASWMS